MAAKWREEEGLELNYYDAKTYTIKIFVIAFFVYQYLSEFSELKRCLDI